MKKVAICLPIHGEPRARFVINLAELCLALGDTPDVEARVISGVHSLVPKIRTDLAREALAWGADQLLWIDSDQGFPTNIYQRLAAHDLPFVAANIVRKAHPFFPVSVGFKNELVFTTEDKARRGVVEEVRYTGFGCVLIAAKVFAAIDRRGKGKTKGAFFDIRAMDGDEFDSEDHYFCHLARAAGFKIMVDHGASWDVTHIGETAFSHQDSANVVSKIVAEMNLPAAPRG